MIDVLKYPAPDWSRKPKRGQINRARRLIAQGGRALHQKDLAEAERLYMASIEVFPMIGSAWFDLGLIYKWRRQWPEAAACNRHSIDLGTSNQDPAYWNLGIASTALHDWETARSAWRGYGIDMELGERPIEADYGLSPVRINPDVSAEVVWGRRIDPARIVIESIPRPGHHHRWHDIILHDGEPRGERVHGDRTYSVFDELERWEASNVPTWECLITGPTDEIDALGERFQAAGWALEDWTVNVRMLCEACSLGSVNTQHSHGPFPADAIGNHIGIAAPKETAEQLLSEWVQEATDRSHTDLVAVED